MKTPTRAWYAEEVAITLRHLVDKTFEPEVRRGRGSMEFGDHVLDVIQGFIHYSLMFDSNPLPVLRRLCPFMNWQYHHIPEDKGHSQSKIVNMVMNCDIFWPGVKHQSIWWYTATRPNITQVECLSISGCTEEDFLREHSAVDGIYARAIRSAYEEAIAMVEYSKM